MNAGEAFCQHFLPDVLKILESAAKQSLVTVNESDDPDLSFYLQQLRSNLVECYTAIVHGVDDQKTMNFLA
jgi:hypothetical protein